MTPSRASSTSVGPAGRDWFTDVGLLVAALSAIVSSGTALAGLARLAGWPTWLAVMLPATVDVYAIIATRVWLSRRTTSEAVRRYAKGNALSAIAASIVGNAVYHALVAGAVHVPRWVLVVAVSMVPPTVIAALAHMTALRTREHESLATAARMPSRTGSDHARKKGSGEQRADRSTRASESADRTPARTTTQTTGGPGRVADPDQFADAVRMYRSSIDRGNPLSERKLADRYGQSRRWARKVMDAARHDDAGETERDDPASGPYLAYTSTEASGGAR